MIHDTLKVVDIHLEQWIAKGKFKKSFPDVGSTNYPRSYQDMADYMNKHIHPDVTRGAIAQQIKERPESSFNELIYLNDHGPDHVKMVINKASELLMNLEIKLTPYEAYIFLVAAHFHDVGIWLGRHNHEKKINKIMQMPEIKKHLPNDGLVLKVIKKIARAHGGYMDGDKDTINPLLRETELNNCKVRKQFLAALLRFSDELADDRTRASRFMVDNGYSEIPEYSKIFHEYSNSLHTVDIKGKDIILKYYIPESKVSQKFPKIVRNNEESKVDNKFLYDEIRNRTMKMHREKMYCMRFLVACGIFIERINVTIEIVDDDFNETLGIISYELKEKGYPYEETDILKLCTELEGKDGRWLAQRFRK